MSFDVYLLILLTKDQYMDIRVLQQTVCVFVTFSCLREK